MIDLQDIKDAREAIEDLIKRTPLVKSRYLSDLCGGLVSLKLENLQLSSSFKIRGALNKMLHLGSEEAELGVATASAGNHGLAVAMVADRLRIPAKIVVPTSTPSVKIERIREYHVEPILYGKIYDEAERKAMEIAERDGLVYISPYNDRSIIAGQGTIGLEVLEDLPSVDTVIVPVGGGGLISGVGTAIKHIKPEAEIVGVQSETSPAMYESLIAGRVVDVELRDSLADGLFGGIEMKTITLQIVEAIVDRFFLCMESTLSRAIYLLWSKHKQVCEGAAAAAIAPLLESGGMFRKKTVVAVITGGNIDRDQFHRILTSEASDPHEPTAVSVDK